MLSGEQLVTHATERIEIVARIGCTAGQHFKARIRRRQRAQLRGVEHRLFARVGQRLRGSGDAEIQHLDFPRVGQESVARLEVGVHDALLVRVTERSAERTHDAERLVALETSAFLVFQRLIERTAAQQFHHHIDIAAVAVEVVYLDDVGMRQIARLARFPLQRPNRQRVPLEFVVQQFDGHIRIALAQCIGGVVQRFIDHAHSAVAELRQKFKSSAQHRTHGQRYRGLG